MVFKSQKELERFLMKKFRLAIMRAQDEVYKILQDFMRKYYADYSPEFYHRTYQLLTSLVQSRIISDGKGYKAEVYFDLDGLKYHTGGEPSGEQVFEAAKQGDHGAIGRIPNPKWSEYFLYVPGNTGVNVWDDPVQKLNVEAYEILKRELIAQGVPIK